MSAMMPVSLASAVAKSQRLREAFCSISSAEVATPPALAALPGGVKNPGGLEVLHSFGGWRACWRPQPPRRSRYVAGVTAASPFSSFWVAQGQRHRAGHIPNAAAGNQLGRGATLDVVGYAPTLNFLNLL